MELVAALALSTGMRLRELGRLSWRGVGDDFFHVRYKGK